MPRVVYFCTGCVMVALGAIGAVTPLLPTTIFLIAAAACHARRRLVWKRGCSIIRDLARRCGIGAANGAISRPAKFMACAGMIFGFVAFWLSAHPSLLLAAGVAVLLLASATYVVSRPSDVA